MKNYKNHIILDIILVGTIIIVGYALKWHDVYQEAYKNKAIISDYVTSITMEEFNSTINDKHNAVIYFGITDDTKCRTFERKFVSSIHKYQLEDEIIYISVNELKDKDISKELDILYGSDELRGQHRYLNKIPAIGIYINAKLVDFVSSSKLTPSSAIDLMGKYGFINDWEQ